MTRASLREYAAIQREWYHAATRAEKHSLLDEVVTVTGVHRKAAIRLLHRPPRAPTARPRAGRPRLYGPAVAAAGRVLWEGTGRIGAVRLQPFMPELLDLIGARGNFRTNRGPQDDSPAGKETLGKKMRGRPSGR